MSKEWRQDKRLYKYGDIEVELEGIRLCDQCGIPVEQAEKTENGITIFNITSPEYMLEQADESERLDPDEFDETTIVELFGKAGKYDFTDVGFGVGIGCRESVMVK